MHLKHHTNLLTCNIIKKEMITCLFQKSSSKRLFFFHFLMYTFFLFDSLFFYYCISPFHAQALIVIKKIKNKSIYPFTTTAKNCPLPNGGKREMEKKNTCIIKWKRWWFFWITKKRGRLRKYIVDVREM